MKRVLSLILALSMVMSMFTFSFAGSLKDIEGTEYEAAVEALIELGIVTGYPDGTYQPNKTVSRAEMAKLLVIAAGLEPAAEVAVGTTKFSDVSADHWACGFINVASEYGYIAGYPEGTFMPDAEVKYSEAVTMALRVLGFRNVIEAKGTWPTNYIAKAQDLEMLDGITYGKYSDGAIRGNVAVLVWNMLKENMWDVNAESEGDGLNYTTTKDAMLNIKFPDYAYSYATFESFEITEDAEVIVTLGDSEKEAKTFEGTEFEYFKNDFYTYVEGTEVEVLVNEKDEVLLTMVPTGKDKLVEGSKAELDDEYESLTGDYDYAYARIKSKDAEASTKLEISSEYIYEVEEKEGKYVKLNGSRKDLEDWDDVKVIIKGDERISIADVEEGDVFSTVKVGNYTFYVVSSAEVEGKLTKYVEEKYDVDSEKYHVITVDGEKYIVDEDATYVIDPEDEDEKQNKAFIKATSDFTKMKNEEVVLYVDFAGRVTRIDFDGSLDEDDDTEVKFFVVEESVEKESNSVYYITLQNEEEEGAKYYFAKSAKTIAQELYAYDVKDIEGAFVAVGFNEDNEIVSFEELARVTLDGEVVSGDVVEIPYGDEEDENEKYVVEYVTATFDDEKDMITVESGDEAVRLADVEDSVIVVSLVYDDNGTEDDQDDDEVYAIYEEGLEAIDNLKNEKVLVVTDADERIKTAIYVVRFDDNSSREDDLAGKLEEVADNIIDGKYVELTIDGKDEIYVDKDDAESLEAVESGVIVYSSKTDKDDNEIVQVIDTVDVATLVSDEGVTYISYKTDKKVEFDFDTAKQYSLKEIVDELYEDALFVAVSVDPDAEDDEDVVTSVKAILAEDLAMSDFAEADRILEGSNGVVYIISGLDEREEPTTESGDQPSGEQPSGEQPSGEQPSGEQPSGEQPSGEQPSGEQPSGEQPSGEQPSGEKFTVTFAHESGDVIESGEYESGEALTAPQAPTVEGKTFVRWDPEVPATVTATATYIAIYQDEQANP